YLEEALIGTKVLSCKRLIYKIYKLVKAAKQISQTPRERLIEIFGSVYFNLILLLITYNRDY
ncbi:hypothetical protein V8F44DRAFT_505105, partial [Aspergillus fumigatus]